jgi:Type IV secretion system pilin/Lysozyme like domain
MRRFVVAVIGLVMVLVVVSPVLATAAGLVPCGGPGQVECQACHVTELINNVVAWLFVVLSIVAAIMIAVAGIKMVVGGSNSGTREEAKSTFTNIIIGFIILMGGWILIDTLMKALLGEGSQTYGMWNQIQCARQPGAYNTPAGSGRNAVASSSYTGVTGGGRGAGAQCHAGNTACSVDALRALGFNDQQANIMSCIAMTESSGNPNAHNPTGGGMGACGTFQFRQTTWNSVRNRPAGCEDYATSCRNHTCNAQMALQLVQRSPSGYSDWTCSGCNTRAQACINRYSGN